jgi:hypothetical protein
MFAMFASLFPVSRKCCSVSSLTSSAHWCLTTNILILYRQGIKIIKFSGSDDMSLLGTIPLTFGIAHAPCDAMLLPAAPAPWYLTHLS